MHLGVLRHRRAADDAALAVVGRHRADGAAGKVDGTAADRAVLDQAAVLRRKAARRAVGGGDGGPRRNFRIADGRTRRVGARDAARHAIGGVDFAVRIPAAVNDAARRVLARNAARQRIVGTHRGLVADIADIGIVDARSAARVGRSRDLGHRHAAGDKAPRAAPGVVAARDAARVGRGRDGEVQLGSAAQRDGAAVDTCHTARTVGSDHRCGGGSGLVIRDRRAAHVDARDTADDLIAAQHNALIRGRVGDAAGVDARDAAQVQVTRLLAAQRSAGHAAADRAVVPAGQAARRAGVGNVAVARTVFQRGIFGGKTDDAARQVAARLAELVVLVQAQQLDALVQPVSCVVGAHAQTADGQRVAAAAVDGIADGQIRRCIVIAKDAADVGVGLEVEGIGEVFKADRRFAAGNGRAVDQHIVVAESGQHGRMGHVLRQGCQQAVVADDAACHAVRADTARRDRGGQCARLAEGVLHGEAAHRHICADDATDKVDALDAGSRHGGGGQDGCGVQADQAAHGVTVGHDLAADSQGLAAGVGDGSVPIVVARQAADEGVAVQDRAQRRGAVPVPGHAALGAVIAHQAAHIVGILGDARVGAQCLQKADAAAVGGIVAGHTVGAVDKLRFFGLGGAVRAPGGVVDTDDAADVGCIFAQARNEAAVGAGLDDAAAAVDRHDAAHIAVAEHITGVGGAVCVERAAGEAARQAADKAAAQDIAFLGAAVLQQDIFAKAHKAADEIALEGAVVVQRAVAGVACIHLTAQVGLGHRTAGGAGAVGQHDILGVARNAAEELAQHQAVLGLSVVALIVHARADRAGAGESVYDCLYRAVGGGIGAVQVARNAAHKATAGDIGCVGNDRFIVGFQVACIQRAEHAAHADTAPAGGCFRVTRVGGHSGIAGLFPCFAGFVGGVGGIVVHQQARHRNVLAHGQVFQLGACIVFGYGNAHEAANALRLVLVVFVRSVRDAGLFGRIVVKMQRGQHLRLVGVVGAVEQRAVLQCAGVDAAQRTHGAHTVAAGGVAFRQFGQVGRVRQADTALGHALPGGQRLDFGVDLHVGVAQRNVGDRAVVLAHQAYIAVQRVLIRLVNCRDRIAAQLQVENRHAGRAGHSRFALQGDIFPQRGDGGPGHRAGLAGNLGLGVFAHTRRRVDGDAAAGPVQAVGAHALGFQGVGGFRIAPVFGPADIVKVAEIFQLCVGFGAVDGKQRVLGVGVPALAGGVAVGILAPRGSLQTDDDILRLGQQADDAVQVVVGGAGIFLTGAQQRGIGHGVQRQDKVALVVAQRIAQGALGLGPCAVGAVGVDGGFQFRQHLLFGVGALDLDGEQRLRFIGNFVAGQAVFLGLVGHCRVDRVHVGQVGVAAPAQGQRLAVGQARVLDFQLRLLQFHHVDAVLGRVVTHQAVIAAVVIAAVGDIGCVGHAVRGKAQLVGVRVIEHRVHLPAGPVDLHADGGAKHRIIVDIIVQQPPDQLVLARAVGLIIVQRVDAVVQLTGRAAAHLIPGGIGDDNIIGKVRARLALILDIGAECIQFARSIHAGQRDLRRLEQRAGVGLVFLKPGQASVGDKAAAHQRSQYAHNGQHDHKLYHRKTAGALFVFALMQHRCSLHI